MQCPVCGRPAEAGQRFCTGCGNSLKGITDDPAATSAIPVQPAGDPPADDWDPVWAPTGSIPVQPAEPNTAPSADPPGDAAISPPADDLPPTEPVWASPVTAALPVTERLTATEPVADPTPVVAPELPEREPDSDRYPVLTPYDYSDGDPVADGYVASPATEVIASAVPYAPVREVNRFHVNAVLVLGVAAGLVALGSLFTTVLSVESSRRLEVGPEAPAAFRTGTWILDDLADNLSIAGLLAVLAMIAGGVASGFRWRWGGGLAAGGGLALVGLAGLALGLTQVPIDAAHDFALIPADPPFTLTITRDVGYYLLIVASALALVLFFASLNDLVGDRRPGLNPWIAALGALAAVVAAAGPTLNEQSARFSDNWYLLDTPDGPPALLLIGRAVQIVLLVLTGLVGFLCVRRYGIGLAAGGALPYIWLGVSTLFELTDNPVGPAFRNPGSVETDVHGLTVIGIAALGSMLVLAIIAAYDQGIRERR